MVNPGKIDDDGCQSGVRGSVGLDKQVPHGAGLSGLNADMGNPASHDFADLFEHAPVGYMVQDDEGRIVRVNRIGANILGWDADWLRGKLFLRWVVGGDKHLFVEHRRRLRYSPDGLSLQLRIKNRQGCYAALRLESKPDPGGNGARIVMIDVSGELQSARRVRRLQSQLTHMTRLHTAGELASNLAHELNQPLGTVVLNCEAAMRLLQTESTDKCECIEALSQATEAASFGSDVIRHLRGFLRKNGEMQQACRLRTIINDVLTLIETDARDNDIELRLDIDYDLPAVCVDPVQIEQVLVNLTHNSVEAISEADVVGPKQEKVRAGLCGPGKIKVSVSDTGPGLTGKQVNCLFSPFYTTKTDGMGMGLSISRTIIEAHGGKLWADADAAGGACFHFTLPTAGADGDGDAE